MPNENHPASQPLATLTLELAELILTCAIRSAAISTTFDPTAMCRPLNALPRSTSPSLTYAALVYLPHIDVEVAASLSDLGLLKIMFNWSKKPRGRPIQYLAERVIGLAMAGGSVEVLDWLLDHLYCSWSARDVRIACIGGHVDVLDWWKKREFAGLASEVDGIAMLVHSASRHGRVDVLDWLHQNVGIEHVSSSKWSESCTLWPFHSKFGLLKDPVGDVLGAAAENGHVDVLNWWWTKAQDGLISQPALDTIIESAFENNQELVLEWCLMHPEVVEQYNAIGHTTHFWMMAAMKPSGVSLEWIDRLGVVVAGSTYCSIPFSQGHLPAAKWLHTKGFLKGSRLEMVYHAAEAPTADLQVFDWIHANIPQDSPRHNVRQSRWDPFYPALANGRIAVLDWLLEHGYLFPQAVLSKYFKAASSRSDTLALDWLFGKVLELQIDVDLADIALSDVLQNATLEGLLPVLDWWLTKLSSSSPPPCAPVYCHGLLLHACYLGRIDVIEWWLYKSGPLRTWFTFESTYVKTCGRYPRYSVRESLNHERQVDVLNAWFRAGYPIADPVACIYEASVAGNLQALDWLLHVAKVPMDAFHAAYTSKLRYPIPRPNPRSRPQSILWWWANVSAVHGLAAEVPAQWYPMNTFLLKEVLKLPEVQIPDPVRLSQIENTAMLQYLAQIGEWKVLNNGCEAALIAATKENLRHVLEWWKNESGAPLRRPKALDLDKNICADVKQWWLATGAVTLGHD